MSKKNIKFKLNRKGVKSLLKSEEMKNLLSEEASKIREKCGDGYKNDTHIGKNRVNAMVWADSIKAKKDNLKNNTLLKAMR